MSEAGCSVGHKFELFVAKQVMTSHSPNIPGKEFVEPRGFWGWEEKCTEILPKCDSLRF